MAQITEMLPQGLQFISIESTDTAMVIITTEIVSVSLGCAQRRQNSRSRCRSRDRGRSRWIGRRRER